MKRLSATRWPKRILVVTLIALALWFISWLAARWLIVTASPDRGDAILLLSGSSSIHERAHYAAQLYSQHRAPKILLTNDNQMGGWSSVDQRNPYYYEIARLELQQMGVPSRDIEVIGPVVDGTYDEANVVRQFLAGRNINSIVIVTSAYHSRRALSTFRSVFEGSGITIGLAAVPPGWQTPKPATWWLTPRGWQLVAGEYLKLFFYKLRR
jgi:uncharacterized SAM-binding protein YcdF (DUF218 family)